MTQIADDLSPHALAMAIEENMFAGVAAGHRWPQVKLYESDEIQWSLTHYPYPMFNSVMRARLTEERVDTMIETVLAQAKKRRVPLAWWIGPSTQPANLSQHLEKYGFVFADAALGMAADLTRLPAETPVMDFAIQETNDAATLRQWCQISNTVFEMPSPVAEIFFDFLTHMNNRTHRAFLGAHRGQPVSTSMLILVAGVAGVYNVATLSNARRRGIGFAMTHAAMMEARKAGYRIATLQATEEGVGVYRRLGFREYCKFSQYLWSPPDG